MRDLLREQGYVRYLSDEAQLMYQFGKYSDDDCRKLLSNKSNPSADLRSRAYKQFVARYQLEDEEGDGQTTGVQDLPLSAVACEGLMRFVEQGHVPTPAWNFQLAQIWDRVKHKAKGWEREQRQPGRAKSG